MQTMAQDFYKTLDVSKTASADEIQKAYRKLARKYHPDLNPDDKAAQTKFKEIQTAYDCLSDIKKRQLYDQYGDQYEQVSAAGGSAAPGGFSFEDIFQGGGGQFGDIGDIFRQFGGGAGQARSGRGRGRTPTNGGDLNAELTVPFNSAVLGGQSTININRGGKLESLQVKIPAGVESGQKIRLRGQGEPSQNGGVSGDLLITITVASHPYFKRVGKNLELRLPVTLGEAALGAKVDLPTPTGTMSLTIPAGSSSGRRLRVKGQGVCDASGKAGDLYVELLIKIPEKLDDESRQAIERLEKLYTDKPRSGIIW